MFSTILNMCSATAATDRDARTAIVHATLELVGERGPAATTVRAVAERAGVSPPLVMFHYGSKDGLITACDEHVRALMGSAIEAIMSGLGDEATLHALLALPDVADALAYIGRSIQDRGEIGRWWFDEMLRLSLDGLAAAESAGLARPSDDPEMRAVLVMAMDLGMVLMRPLVESRLGASLSDPDTMARWIRTELDVLTHGVMLPRPPDDDHPEERP
jgi:AcrR family transcriptional regulator